MVTNEAAVATMFKRNDECRPLCWLQSENHWNENWGYDSLSITPMIHRYRNNHPTYRSMLRMSLYCHHGQDDPIAIDRIDGMVHESYLDPT